MTTFYPHDEDVEGSSPKARLDLLQEAAERYRAAILDPTMAINLVDEKGVRRKMVPREMRVAFNWQEIAKLLREIREMTEATSPAKVSKAEHLTMLASVYEILRAAKMPKLEAVRIALLNEASHLQG